MNFIMRRFYDEYNEGMSSSAVTIRGLFCEHYKPETVIDVGCSRVPWN